MAISLDAFQRAAATGGRIVLDKRHEDGVTGSHGQMGGKPVTWLNDNMPTKGVKEENRAATQAFIASVRAKYGDLLGNLAEARLAGDIQTGRPLTKDSVELIIGASKRALVDLQQMNEATIKTAARSDDPQAPGSFGKVFDEVAKAMGSSAKIGDLDPGRLAEARLAIENGIKAETEHRGTTQLELVDDNVAHAIATREIRKLLGANDRDAMIKELTTPGNGSAPLDKLFNKELAARGMTQLTHEAFDLRPLQRAAQTAIVEASFNPNENAYTAPVDRAKAEALIEEQIKRFLDGQKASLDMVKQLAGSNQTHEAILTKHALGSEGMTPAMLEKLWQSREVAEKALRTLALPTSSTGEQVKALNELAKTIAQASGDLHLDGSGAERFRSALVSVALDALELESHAVQNIRSALTSPKLTAVEDALAVGNREGVPPQTRKSAQDLAAIFKPLREAVGATEPPPRQVSSLGSIPREALTALKDNGIDLGGWVGGSLPPERQAAFDKAKELAAGNSTHQAALEKLVRDNRGMTAAMLEKLWQARDTAEKTFTDLAKASTLTDQVGVLTELAAAFDKAARELGLSGPEATAFRRSAMQLAGETTALDQDAREELEDGLGSPKLATLSDALSLAASSSALPQETRQAARGLFETFATLHATMGPGSPPRTQLTSLDQVSAETLHALRDNGVEIEPRMAKAKELAGGNVKHATALTSLVQQNPTMSTDMLEKLWQARGAVEQAFRGIAGGHTLADQVGALKELTAAISRAVGDLGLQGSDADTFRSMAMSLAQTTTGLGPATQALLRTALGSELMVEMGNALAHASSDGNLPTETRETARRLHDQLAGLHLAMGLSPPPDNPSGSLDQVAPWAFEALRTHGIEIDPSRV